MNKIKKSNRENTILSGALSLTLSTVVVKVLGLIYKIPLSHLLFDEGMGYFNSAYTVYTFFYILCTAGVPKAVMILVSEAKERGKTLDEKKIVNVSIRSFLILGFISTLSLIVFSAPLSNLIGNSKSAFTMVAIAPSIIIVAIAGVIRGYLSANMMLLDIAVSQIIEGVFKLLLGLFFAILGSTMKLPLYIISALTILGVSIGALFGLIYLLIRAKDKYSVDRAEQNLSKIEYKHILRKIFKISLPITASAAVMSISNIIDLTIIMKRLISIGYSEIASSALYGNYTTLAVPMFNFAASLITPISIIYLPIFTRSYTRGNNKDFSLAIKNALFLSSIVAAPIMIGFMVFSKEILTLIFGNSAASVGAPLLTLLSPSIMLLAILLIVNSSLEASGKIKVPLIAMLIGSFIKVIVSYILISNKTYGILGAPISTVFSYATALMVSLIIAEKSKIKYPIFTTGFLPYTVAFLTVIIGKIAYYRIILVANNIITLLISILISAVLYFIILTFLGVLKKDDITKLANYTNFA